MMRTMQDWGTIRKEKAAERQGTAPEQTPGQPKDSENGENGLIDEGI